MLFKDENLGEDMVGVLRNLHEWVPDANESGEEILDRVPVMGVQKNNGAWIGGQISVSNA